MNWWFCLQLWVGIFCLPHLWVGSVHSTVSLHNDPLDLILHHHQWVGISPSSVVTNLLWFAFNFELACFIYLINEWVVCFQPCVHTMWFLLCLVIPSSLSRYSSFLITYIYESVMCCHQYLCYIGLFSLSSMSWAHLFHIKQQMATCTSYPIASPNCLGNEGNAEKWRLQWNMGSRLKVKWKCKFFKLHHCFSNGRFRYIKWPVSFTS